MIQRNGLNVGDRSRCTNRERNRKNRLLQSNWTTKIGVRKMIGQRAKHFGNQRRLLARKTHHRYIDKSEKNQTNRRQMQTTFLIGKAKKKWKRINPTRSNRKRNPKRVRAHKKIGDGHLSLSIKQAKAKTIAVRIKFAHCKSLKVQCALQSSCAGASREGGGIHHSTDSGSMCWVQCVFWPSQIDAINTERSKRSQLIQQN